jgi:2-isopropylmalate synthase
MILSRKLLKLKNNMKDLIVESTRQGGVVYWEEVARDGAQSKTIMSGTERANIANKHANLFNGTAHKHLIFAAGFPSVGKNEMEAIVELSEKVDSCYLATHGRPTRRDMDLGLKALEKAKYGRVSFLLPATEHKAQRIMKCSLDDAFSQGLDLIKYVKDKKPDMPVDIALMDSPVAKMDRLSGFINAATEEGLSIAKICDTRGIFYPNQVFPFFEELIKSVSNEATLGIHFHNDLGFGLSNTLKVLEAGLRMISTSWLGLGERAGLVPTEQLLFLLSNERNLLFERTGIQNAKALFSKEINLKGLVDIAKEVSDMLNIPIRSTDPIIGSGLTSISTGLPFGNPIEFQPFDPQKTLGLKQDVVITHLASKKVIDYVAKQNGFIFLPDQLKVLMEIIKNKPYDSKKPIVEKDELINIFNMVKNR